MKHTQNSVVRADALTKEHVGKLLRVANMEGELVDLRNRDGFVVLDIESTILTVPDKAMVEVMSMDPVTRSRNND